MIRFSPIHPFTFVYYRNQRPHFSILSHVLLAIVYGITVILQKKAFKVALYASPPFSLFPSLNDMIVGAFGFK